MGFAWQRLLFVICALAAALQAPEARADDALRQQLQHCLEVPSALRRLDCFDRLARSTVDGEADASVASLPPTPAERDADVEERVGAERPRRSGTSREPPESVDSVSSRIARMEQRPRGEFVFHLENGQIWTELEAGRGRYENGMEVTIRRTRFGGFMLSSNGGRATRVRRIE